MTENKQIVVCVMPWANLKQEVKIGKTTFWPWDKGKVADASIGEVVQEYVRHFVDEHGKAVSTVAVCSYEGKGFLLPEEDGLVQMRSARDILVFSVICPQVITSIRGCSIGLCSAERFQVMGQGLDPDRRAIYVQSGYNTTMGDFTVSRPLCVAREELAQPKELLLAGFDKALSGTGPSCGDLAGRLTRCLEWFRLAHAEPDQSSELSKIVMMATAFEVLLEFPKGRKSHYFAQKIEEWLGNSDCVHETRSLKSHDGEKEDHTLSKAAWWAYDFYQLRNRIVHGDRVELDDTYYNSHITQRDVADAVLYDIVCLMLHRRGCLACKPDLAALCSGDSADKQQLEEYLLLQEAGLDDVHRCLGWMVDRMS